MAPAYLYLKVYEKNLTKLVNALPMDDVTFTTQLRSKKILPAGVNAHIKSLPIVSDKADYYLNNVIKKSLDIGEITEFKNLLTVMEKCEYSHIERLANKMKLDLDKEVKAKASESKAAKGKKSDDAKPPSKAGVKRAASISAPSSESLGAKRKKPSDTKVSNSKEAKGKKSDDAKVTESKAAKGKKPDDAKASESKEAKGKKSDDAKPPSKPKVKGAASISAMSSEHPGTSRKEPSDKCRKAIENITTNYPKLTRSLPIDDLIPDLFSKKVISGVQKENIQKEKLKKGKVSFLFDEVIIPGLQSGTSTKYNNLIKVMDASDDTTANRLAGILKGTNS